MSCRNKKKIVVLSPIFNYAWKQQEWNKRKAGSDEER